MTILDYNCFFIHFALNMYIIVLLLKIWGYRINIIIRLHFRTMNSSHSLHVFSIYNHNFTEIIISLMFSGMTKEILDKMGARLIKQADHKGWIPLHYAAEMNSYELVRELLSFDKSTAYVKDIEGTTALHNAACHDTTDILRLFRRLCPDCFELVDNKGWNILHFAVENDSPDAVRFILEKPSLSDLLNEKDADGNTPLHHVATSLNYLSHLISHPRVDKLAFNRKNQNALDIVSANKMDKWTKVYLSSFFYWCTSFK